MSRRVWLLIVVIAAVAVGSATLVLRRHGAPPQTAAPAPEASADAGTVKFSMEQQWAIRMKLAQGVPATVARQITAPGRVVPAAGHHAVVASPVPGTITGPALPRVGQQIARGQTVAVLRQTPTATEAAQVAASETQAHVDTVRLDAEQRRLTEAIKAAELRRDHARHELERARHLYEAKAYALRQVEAAEAEYRTAETIVAGTVAQRDSLRGARVSPPPSASATSAVHIVQAPLSGTVIRVAKAVGEAVAVGEGIAEIVDSTTVWVEIAVAERDLSRLGGDIRASFRAPGSETEFSGRLIDGGTVVSPQTRTATVVFELPNPRRALRVGTQIEARLDASERVSALMVPREAVIEADGRRYVYVLVTGEEFHRREVTVGDEHGHRVAVVAGLKPGERVVTQGAWQVRQQELRPASAGVHTHE